MSTGIRIRRRREALGWSRQDLAERLGTTRMSVWRIEAGHTQVKSGKSGPLTLKAIARRLRMKVAELVA